MTNKVWLDKAQFLEEYNVYPDSKFYSVEYTGPYAAELCAYAQEQAEFRAWCKEAYLSVRAGSEMPAIPEFLVPKVEVADVEETPESDSKEG